LLGSFVKDPFALGSDWVAPQAYVGWYPYVLQP
jgi:hypothetical protein